MRGKHVSKKIEDIVDEASELAKKGIKEILLIAQDLSYYGVDIYKKRKLYDLLVELSKVDGIEWIRLHHESATGRDGYQDFYKKNINFKVLGPVGDIVEKWTLYGTYIQDATFGDLDFTTSDPVEITLQLKYDYAILEF